MTETLARSPTPLSRVWSGTKVIAEDIEGDDLSDVLQMNADASAWWVMSRDSDRAVPELRRAAHVLGVDEPAIRDLLADDRRAKYEDLDKSKMVVTNAVTLDQQAIELTHQPVSMLVTDRALICLVDSGAGGVDPAGLLARRSQQLGDGGAEHAMQLVVGAVIDSYQQAVEWLEDRSDDLAEALFGGQPLTQEQQLQAFRLRTVLSQLRRLTEPMREVMDDVVDGDTPDPATDRRWTLLRERHLRVAGAADALREALSSTLETSLALADLRMNVVMKQLTGWAGIIAVPTLVTGFAGMNVSFPLDGTVLGFWVYAVVMVVAVVILFVLFKRKDWI